MSVLADIELIFACIELIARMFVAVLVVSIERCPVEGVEGDGYGLAFTRSEFLGLFESAENYVSLFGLAVGIGSREVCLNDILAGKSADILDLYVN